jgi:hypothetical protein
MSLYKQFKTHKESEENGIIIRFKKNDDGTIPSFKIARASSSNKNWAKTFEAKARPFKRDIEEKVLSEEDANDLNIDVFVSAILQGWENVQDEHGKNIVYNRDNAIKLFHDLPELYETLDAKSKDMQNFLEANLKADEKN